MKEKFRNTKRRCATCNFVITKDILRAFLHFLVLVLYFSQSSAAVIVDNSKNKDDSDDVEGLTSTIVMVSTKDLFTISQVSDIHFLKFWSKI